MRARLRYAPDGVEATLRALRQEMQELVELDGLPENGRARRDDVVVGDLVARDEDHLEMRKSVLHDAQEVEAVELGHADVGDDEPDAGIAVECIERLSRRVG